MTTRGGGAFGGRPPGDPPQGTGHSLTMGRSLE